MIDRLKLMDMIEEVIPNMYDEHVSTLADHLLERLEMHEHQPDDKAENMVVRMVLQELHRAQKKHPGRIVLRHQGWGIIDEEWTKCKWDITTNDSLQARKHLATTAAMCIRTLMDWRLIEKVESDLVILQRLETEQDDRGLSWIVPLLREWAEAGGIQLQELIHELKQQPLNQDQND